MGRNKKFTGEDTAPIRVPESTKQYIEQLLDIVWTYIKNHPSSKEDSVLLVFKYLIQKTLEFSDLIEEQEQETKPLFTGEFRKVKFRSPEDSPTLLPIKHDGRVAASFDLSTAGEEETSSEPIDLHQVLIKEPNDTLITFVGGDSMNRSGINEGDLLVFKKSIGDLSAIRDGTIVIAQVEGNQTVKRLDKEKGSFFLRPDSDNEEHKEIEIKKGIEIIGIVLYSIHSLEPRHAWGI